MLSPEWYEACTDQILVLYSRLEDDILKDIVRRILKTNMVTESAKWQAEMLQEAGLLYNDIMQEIAKYTSKTTEEVCLLFEEAGTEVMRNDNVIAQSTTGQKLHLSDSGLQILKADYRNTLGNLQNLTNTTAMTSQAAFIAACNDAHMQITSGAFSYQEAVRNAIRRAAQGGLTVKYPTGHIDKLDVAVRRAALTGVGQTAAKLSIMNAEEMDCDLMEITAHAGARPEHTKWQGKLVSRTGKNVGRIVDGVRVLSLTDIGYGTGAGFRGWNCRHDWHPYFEGYSTLNYTDEELAKLDEKNIEYDGKMYSQYEISQMQRAQERKIRELKRQTVKMQDAADFATDPKLKELAKTDHQAMSVKLKTAEKELKDFCKATGQDRDKFREQVLGFSKSEAQRAVQAAKKATNNIDYMSRFNPTFSDEKVLTTGNLSIRTKTVSNSKFKMFTDIDADRKNKAVRLTEKNLIAVQKSLPENFEMPSIAVVDFNKHKLNTYAIGGYDKNTGIMYINSRYDTTEKVLAYVNQTKGQFANTTEYAPILHELGHKYYEDSIKKLAISENMSYNDIKNRIDNRIYDYVHERNTNGRFLEENLSEYAQKGYDDHAYTEIIAESFSVYSRNSFAIELLRILGGYSL